MEIEGEEKVYRTRTTSNFWLFFCFNISDYYLTSAGFLGTHPLMPPVLVCRGVFLLLFIFFACTVSPIRLSSLFPICLVTIQLERETL